ncbi:hybrid sensor histidine kinase/response regulator [Filimonas effusa]|uniref:histidine kinase n=1 Tax=Filimonas effusa TaxID=2508721 RepID=A0A4Q1D1K1_9BACT|nr:hybrid sensor histidine kinase/response regulator [Filimonas effusa]RXK81691.1 response regulator [Filimonas effusa]
MIYSLWMNLINIGVDAKTPTDTATSIRLVNTMNAVTAGSAIFLAPLLTYTTGKPILLPGYIEASLFLISFWLNHKRKHFLAASLMLFTQNAAALYFGLHFGLFVPIVSLCIALGLTSFFLFQGTIKWLPGFLLSFLVINAIYFSEKSNLIVPWKFQVNEENSIVYLANVVIYLLSAIVVGFYTKQIRAANRYKTKYLTKTNHEINRHVFALQDIVNGLPINKDSGKIVISDSDIRLLKKYIQSIGNVVQGGLQLVKIESGHYERANYEHLELDSLLIDIKDEAEAFLTMRNLRLTFNVDPAVPKVIYTDRNKLGFILSNLISNAIKFSNKNSGIIVNISMSQDSIIYQVLDFGKGMSRLKLSEIFHRLFVTEDNLLVQGNGIALPMIREFVDLLKGRITVDSDLGKGTCFTVYLPNKEEDETVEQGDIKWDGSILKGRKVIAVDDDIMGREFMRKILLQMGGEVFLCKDTLEAMEAFRSVKADLIMMDIRLERNVDGLDFIKENYSLISGIPVIMHSSEDSDILQAQIEKAGFIYLKKSLSADDLHNTQRVIRNLMRLPLNL